MLGGSGGDPAGNAAQTFLDQLLQTPACAVTGQHGQIVQMDEALAVGLRDLIVIDLSQPVVGCDGAGVGQDQAADTQSHCGVLFDTPVFLCADITVDQLLVVQQGLLGLADLLVLAAVEDVALGCPGISGLHQRALDAVLDLLDFRHLVSVLAAAHQKEADGARNGRYVSGVHFAGGDKCLRDRILDLCYVKFHDAPVALPDLGDTHSLYSPFSPYTR